MNRLTLAATFLFLAIFTPSTFAQHLWWNADNHKNATCVYGRVTVLVTHENTYYCGINWHPGEPAGGYCGIQHNSGQEHRTIFSIWDTSPTLHPTVTAADAKTQHGRFGGEGEGGHTHMLWPWKVGETFEFYLTKTPGKNDSTEVAYYVFDREAKQWIHSATISCPNGGNKSVENFTGGGIASFLENFSGKDKDAARLAIYRLWVGDSPANLVPLTKAGGDGKWGTLHDSYFLAAGSKENLDKEFARLKKEYGDPQWGGAKQKPAPISALAIDAKVIEALQKLPSAPKVIGDK